MGEKVARMKKCVINFGPGPAKLPLEVMQKAQENFLDYDSTGMSIMELSHRSTEFSKLLATTECTLRQLLHIPHNYKVLFLQGGGCGQFSAVPQNLIGRTENGRADYIVTGSWSAAAAVEAEKYGTINRVCSAHKKYTSIPDPSTWYLDPTAAYVFYCANETIDGVEFPFVPDTHGVPLVCDMSSSFLSKPFDITQFGLVFAGAQKNIGCAGVTLVIVRQDLLGSSLHGTPSIWDYGKQSECGSCFNTPPTFSIYMLSLVLDWIRDNGGAEGMHQRTLQRARAVYDVIDSSSGFYTSQVTNAARSHMNIPFRIDGGNDALENKFLEDAGNHGMIQLKGHRSVGGLRVSLYNAITMSEVTALTEFMLQFQRSHQTEESNINAVHS